jgi:hypothetical protein
VRKNRLSPAGRNGHDAAPRPAAGSASATDAAVDFDANGPTDQKQISETDAFERLIPQFSELRECCLDYLSARVDGACVGLRNALFGVTLAALALVVVAGLSVTATWLVVNGVAEGLGVLFGNRPWAGNLLTGLLLVAGLVGGLCVIRLKNRSDKRFLADQAADARRAFMQTVHEMRQTVAKAADVRTCAREHPWITTGSAVASGFVAGAVLSSPRSTSGEKSSEGAEAGAPLASNGHEQARPKSAFLRSTLGTALSGIVQTLLQSVIAAAVAAADVDQTKEESRTPHNSPPPETPERATPTP